MTSAQSFSPRFAYAAIAAAVALACAGCGRTALTLEAGEVREDGSSDGGARASTDAATIRHDGGKQDAPDAGADDAALPEEPATPPWELDGGDPPDAECAGQALASGRCLVTLASDQERPSGIAIDAKNVYWTNEGYDFRSGSVAKVGRWGGAPVTLASGQREPRDIAVDGVDVFWSGHAITAVSVDGGAPRTIFDDLNSDPRFVTRSASRLYWANRGLVSALPDGSQLFTLTDRPITIAGLAATSRGIVYTEASSVDSEPSRLKTRTFSGDVATILTTRARIDRVKSANDIVVYMADFTSMYWLPLDGGPSTFLGSNIRAIDIVTDGTHVYWTDVSLHAIVRLDIAAGAPEVLVSDVEAPVVHGNGWLTLDSSSVYFTEPYAGKVLKLTPR